MLKKMLKYDLRAIFKFWWIGAVVCLSGGILDGFCQREMYSVVETNYLLQSAAELVQGLIYTSYVLFVLLTLVLFFIRFYKNFFTDEGYLTFTLPVSRKHLLNSKLLSGIIAMFATIGVLFTAIIISAVIFSYGDPLEEEIIVENQLTATELYYQIAYWLEGITLGALVVVLTVIFMGFCITFGSTIVKKGKLFASIGIFYGASSTVMTIFELCLIFSLPGLLNANQPAPSDLSLLLMLTCLIFFFAMLCALFYTLQYRMLERKLNLS